MSARPAPEPAPASDAAGGDLRVDVETPLPEALPAGRATALFLFGSCFHRRAAVRALEVLVDGEPQPVSAHGMPRLDLFRSLHPHLGTGERPIPASDPGVAEDPEVRCYRSGFWATVPVPAIAAGGEIALAVRAKLEGGGEATAEIARIPAGPPPLAPAASAERTSRGPMAPSDVRSVQFRRAAGGTGADLIAVCMATFNPDMELFRAQVESLRTQTDTDWACFVSDDCSRPARWREIEAELAGDERFVLSRSERRLGFYRSFERALGMVPPEASLVALCDQDDRWYPEKLATLRAELGDAQLVYSDMRLVDTEGRTLADTYWTTRPNNHTNLLSLLIANTITGAASLMRREVVETALPFPEVPGEQYHDHWLGLVAMTLGDVAYVDRPLYDYVQHGGATLGHAAANAGFLRARWLRRWLDRLHLNHWRHLFNNSRSAYFRAYVRLQVLAEVLLQRCGKDASVRKRAALRRFARAERTPLGAGWFALRSLRSRLGRGETLGAETLLAQGVLWRYVLAQHSRGELRPSGSLYDASMPPSPGSTAADIHRDPETAHIQRMIEPLHLSVSELEPKRVNLLIPTIDLQHLFGGYIAKFNLARKLAEGGHRVRLVAVDPTPPLPDDWRRQVEAYSGLAGAFDRVEVAFARDADRILPVSPDDLFIATTWWTAHHAQNALAQVRAERFLYLIQEYEPFTFVMGSWAALAMQTYTFGHCALFSTELLRRYFAAHGHGVFAAGAEAGEADSLSFQNAITAVNPPTAAALAARQSRRLLFYARSEPHAKRNMFELGLIAISRAIEAGVFGPEWEFFGIGSVSGRSSVGLPGGAQLEILSRRSQSDYGEMLGAHDVGLSLMFTPHPSLVPIEMASAGLLTVTNSFDTKTPESLTAISSNLIVSEPSIDGVVAGLGAAVGRVGEHEARVAGAAVEWSSDWERSFGPEQMRRIDELLARCRG